MSLYSVSRSGMYDPMISTPFYSCTHEEILIQDYVLIDTGLSCVSSEFEHTCQEVVQHRYPSLVLFLDALASSRMRA